MDAVARAVKSAADENTPEAYLRAIRVVNAAGPSRRLLLVSLIARYRASMSTEPPKPQEAAETPVATTNQLGLPIPLPIKIVPEPQPVPDNLPATLQQPDKDNPAIVPVKPNPKLTLKEIAGNDRAKDLIRQLLIEPFRLPHLYPPDVGLGGMLLYGVAGTGKTTLVKAAVAEITSTRSPQQVAALRANEKLNRDGKNFVQYYTDDGTFVGGQVPEVLFFAANVSDIKSMYIGEGSRKMKRFFEMARETAPSVIFFDEADTYLSPEDEHNSDIITTFKQQMGGLESKSVGGGRVTVIVATNYPMKIEAPIRSRLASGSAEITLPNFQARKDILRNEIRKTRIPEVPAYDEEGLLKYIACRTRPPPPLDRTPWSGRDLEGLVRTAFANNRSRVATGYVMRCGPNCKAPWFNFHYTNVDDVYVEVTNEQLAADKPTGAEIYQAATIINSGEGARILPLPLMQSDFEVAFTKISSSVDTASVVDQMNFNAERGLLNTDPSAWWVSKYVSRGIMTTIPDDGDGGLCS